MYAMTRSVPEFERDIEFETSYNEVDDIFVAFFGIFTHDFSSLVVNIIDEFIVIHSHFIALATSSCSRLEQTERVPTSDAGTKNQN